VRPPIVRPLSAQPPFRQGCGRVVQPCAEDGPRRRLSTARSLLIAMRRFTPQEVDTIRVMAARGFSGIAIARELGRPALAIRKKAVELGVRLRPMLIPEKGARRSAQRRTHALERRRSRSRCQCPAAGKHDLKHGRVPRNHQCRFGRSSHLSRKTASRRSLRNPIRCFD
jgi:hypothetical protein